MLYRHNTIGSSAYKSNAISNVPRGRVPSVLFRSLNKVGRVEDFKGNPKDTFNAMYKNAKFPAVFAIGLWRDNHDFKRSDDDFVVEKAKELQRAFTGKPIYFMPFLEDRLSASHKKETYEKIRRVAPKLLIVDCPITGGEWCLTADYFEVHYSSKPRGRKPPQHLMIYCFDGVNAFDGDFQKLRDMAKGAHMFSIWLAVYNVRLNTNDTTPRPNRKSYPLPEHYEQGEYMLAHPRAANSSMKKPRLYKSNADRHKPGKQDPRADTPVFSINKNKNELVVKDAKGKKVFSAQNVAADKHTKGNWLYRPSTLKWPFQWSDQAFKQSGKYLCTVEIEGEVVGTVDLSYRDYPYKSL